MKTLALAIATTALTASVAAAAGISTFDTNGDRFASFQEVVAANPKINRNDFRELDVNRDNRLSSNEVQAAGAQGILNRGINPKGRVATVRGFASFAQLASSHPGLSRNVFREIDINRDNRVSSVEILNPNAQALLGRYEEGDQILVALTSIDTNGDRFASLSELQVAYPRLTANDLRDFDVNRDRRISSTEYHSLDAIQTLGSNK